MKLKYGSGDIIRKGRQAELSALICSIILPSIIKILQSIVELCSRNKNEVKILIRGHNQKTKKVRIVILVRNTPR